MASDTTSATMHTEHKEWLSEHDMWRCDLSSWQDELKQAAANLKQIEAALKSHEEALQAHAASIRLREQEIASHEHALATIERGERASDADFLAESHAVEADRQKRQAAAHERIKRHHHALIAELKCLQKAVAKSL